MEHCDLCELSGCECPGIKQHCKNGTHCTDVIEVCSKDDFNEDHSLTCCHCHRLIYSE